MRGSNREVLAWSVVFGVGILIIVSTYLPFFNPPQCPEHYTQAQVDAGNCIIGANIGTPLVRLLGIFMTIVTAVGLLVSLAARLTWTRR